MSAMTDEKTKTNQIPQSAIYRLKEIEVEFQVPFTELKEELFQQFNTPFIQEDSTFSNEAERINHCSKILKTRYPPIVTLNTPLTTLSVKPYDDRKKQSPRTKKKQKKRYFGIDKALEKHQQETLSEGYYGTSQYFKERGMIIVDTLSVRVSKKQ